MKELAICPWTPVWFSLPWVALFWQNHPGRTDYGWRSVQKFYLRSSSLIWKHVKTTCMIMPFSASTEFTLNELLSRVLFIVGFKSTAFKISNKNWCSTLINENILKKNTIKTKPIVGMNPVFSSNSVLSTTREEARLSCIFHTLYRGFVLMVLFRKRFHSFISTY